jgi:DNA repair protein RadC
MEAVTMRQAGTHKQLGLFSQETATMTTATAKRKKCEGIPIYKVTLVRERKMCCYDQKIRGSADASELLQRYLSGVDREHFVVMLLDRKNKVIGLHTVSVGSLTASVVHPRETFKVAILANAAAVIFGHNHPSGDPQPSGEDRALTKRLVEAGKLLGISVLDHIVIGHGTSRHFSFADEGLL